MTSRGNTTAALNNVKSTSVDSVVCAKKVTSCTLLLVSELIKMEWLAQIAIQIYSTKRFIGIVSRV
jgi:hypothetical protein